MKKDKLIYRITTGITVFVVLFSLYKMYTPAYERLGLPGYLRGELTVAKIISLIVLLVPRFPARIKEWAYAGLGITFISASVAHYFSGDPLARSLEPLFFLVVLAFSNFYLHKLQPVSGTGQQD